MYSPIRKTSLMVFASSVWPLRDRAVIKQVQCERRVVTIQSNALILLQ